MTAQDRKVDEEILVLVWISTGIKQLPLSLCFFLVSSLRGTSFLCSVLHTTGKAAEGKHSTIFDPHSAQDFRI